MPKVKKKPAGNAKRAGRKRSGVRPPLFAALSSFWARFSRASIAALVVVGLAGLALLWSGGYVGLMGERASRAAGAGAVAAGFEIRRITVKGLAQTSEDELIGAVGPVIGSSLLHLDLHAARARVEEIGWVRSAAVSRLLPNTLHVSVREREPAAVWQLSGALHLIDENGAVIRPVGAYEYANLPLIVGAGAPGAASGVLAALREEPALWGRASALIRVSERRWNLRTKAGVDIKFPELGYRQAIADLARLHDELRLLDEPLEYIDLRNPENLVYRRKGEPGDRELQDAAPAGKSAGGI